MFHVKHGVAATNQLFHVEPENSWKFFLAIRFLWVYLLGVGFFFCGGWASP